MLISCHQISSAYIIYICLLFTVLMLAFCSYLTKQIYIYTLSKLLCWNSIGLSIKKSWRYVYITQLWLFLLHMISAINVINVFVYKQNRVLFKTRPLLYAVQVKFVLSHKFIFAVLILIDDHVGALREFWFEKYVNFLC